MTTYASFYDAKKNINWQVPIEQTPRQIMNSFLKDYLKLNDENTHILQSNLEKIKIYNINELHYLEGEDPEEIYISQEIIDKLVKYSK